MSFNSLFYGDNLEVMRSHLKDESVDLCYIDPPFNSNRDYFQIYNNIGSEDRAQAQAFVDTWTWDAHALEGWAEIFANTGARYPVQTVQLLSGLKAVLGEGALLAYLVSMTQRLNEIHRVLKLRYLPNATQTPSIQLFSLQHRFREASFYGGHISGRLPKLLTTVRPSYLERSSP